MAAKKKTSAQPSTRLLADAIDLISAARAQVVRQTNSVMVFTYFHIGRLIVEHEQRGKDKAEYGKETIKLLSQKLTDEFGKGFSERNLENMRVFFASFRHRSKDLPIPQTLSAELVNDNQHVTAVLEKKGNKKLKKNEKTQTVSAEFSDDNQEITDILKENGAENLAKSSIPQSVIAESLNDNQSVTRFSFKNIFPLSWSHYILLSRIENEDKIKYLKTA